MTYKEWTEERVLREHNAQAVERRFLVLKDSKRVGLVYLNWPERVEVLGYVELIALLLDPLVERRAREALKEVSSH